MYLKPSTTLWPRLFKCDSPPKSVIVRCRRWYHNFLNQLPRCCLQTTWVTLILLVFYRFYSTDFECVRTRCRRLLASEVMFALLSNMGEIVLPMYDSCGTSTVHVSIVAEDRLLVRKTCCYFFRNCFHIPHLFCSDILLENSDDKRIERTEFKLVDDHHKNGKLEIFMFIEMRRIFVVHSTIFSNVSIIRHWHRSSFMIHKLRVAEVSQEKNPETLVGEIFFFGYVELSEFSCR